MAFAFFQIPVDASPELATPLNTFVNSHQIVRVTREWVDAGRESAWAFCVEYVDGAPESAKAGLTAKVDYKVLLPPAQFEVFARLRVLRKAMAEREGQPVFAVFTNAQLAEIARRGCSSVDDLREVDGIGEARVAKYGVEVVAALKNEIPEANA